MKGEEKTPWQKWSCRVSSLSSVTPLSRNGLAADVRCGEAGISTSMIQVDPSILRDPLLENFGAHRSCRRLLAFVSVVPLLTP